jgi:hypothetical protein
VEAAAPATSVTILLKAPDQVGLNHLATAHGLSHAQRVAALARLLPTAATRRAVVDSLRERGFSITHETAWTIDAQAPSTAVTSMFGRSPSVSSGAHTTASLRAGQVLPQVPPSISAATAVVLARSTGPALFQPRSLCSAQCHDGRDFRNAYSSPHEVIPRGDDGNGALTIATLQFPTGGGWNDSDLTSYAQSVGLPDPVASGQYKQFAVDGTSVPPATKQEGGADEEVDLDQETILSTAPEANQRAYFDTNANKAGYADALGQVLADVTQGPGAMAGGDPKIAALSTSWGTCESEFSDRFAFRHDTIKAVGNILKSLTAAGVTVFAASGDTGIYDCGDAPSSTKAAVDYPASSPQVVGVGGTRLNATGKPTPNTGKNWRDRAWTCVSPQTCQGSRARDTGGSGGGESRLFAKPAYQAAAIGHRRFTTATGRKGSFHHQPNRLVPDIAVDGDPASGFKILTTDPVDVKRCASLVGPLCQPQSFAVGGTSLSAPAAASLFTDMLATHGATAGVGDIHGALYSAYAAHRGVFRDVTTGRNGRQKDLDRQASHRSHHRHGANHARELPVTAQKGYDTVTGLGAPLWPALAPYLFAPAPAAAAGSLRRAQAKHGTRVAARWHGVQAKPGGSAPSWASVMITRNGTTKPVYRARHARPSGSHRFPAAPGRTYALSVVEHDLADHTSVRFTTKLPLPKRGHDNAHATD